MKIVTQTYVGYKDRTFVPFRLLKRNLWWGITEEEIRHACCIAQKIGRGTGTCAVEYLKELTQHLRTQGKLKRNHYVYVIRATISDEDMEVYGRMIDRRFGGNRGYGGFTGPGTAAAPCDLGFCDV